MTHHTVTERAMFEEFASVNGKRPELVARNQAGKYLRLDTATGWMWWQAARRAPAAPLPQGYKITEEQHVAAVKALLRASGVDGLPQRMLDAILAAAPQPPACNQSMQPKHATKACNLNLQPIQPRPAIKKESSNEH